MLETRKQIGSPLIGHSALVDYVAESSDGRFVVSKDWTSEEEKETIIWNRGTRQIVWRSKEDDKSANDTIGDAEAEVIIRSCGQKAPLLWPTTFPEYTADLYCKKYSLYSTITGEKILLGNMPSQAHDWRYDDLRKVIVAGLANGVVAVCRLAKDIPK